MKNFKKIKKVDFNKLSPDNLQKSINKVLSVLGKLQNFENFEIPETENKSTTKKTRTIL